DWGQGEITGTAQIALGDASGELSSTGEDDDLEATADAPPRGNVSRQVSGEIGSATATAPELVDDDDDDDDDEDGDADWDDGDDDDDDDEDDAGDDDDLLDDLVDAATGDHDSPSWSHGLPPQLTAVPFPVDGYPAIIEDHDYEDFGLALKLAGPWTPGEGAVLLGFHALWLAPYGGRYRNAEVTIDRTHHAAHFWVDRFLVPSTAAEQVHHVLWVASKLHEVMPIVHARFGGATMAQKYGGLMGDTSEPFVLGGNPLLKVYSEGGEVAVDAWIGSQRDWSNQELAQMLRELAIEIVSHRDSDGAGGREHAAATSAPAVTGEEVDALFGELTSDPSDDDDDDEEDDDEEEVDLGRHITSYAGELLALRAAAGTLDARAAAKLRPVLDLPAKYEHRRAAVVEVLGALKDRASVPAMIRALDETPIKGSLDAVGKEDFLMSTARALGAIGDPSAIAALSRVVAAKGYHNDKPRPFAANALARCLAAAPEPRDVDDAVLDGLLETIRDRNDGPINAEAHLAFGRIAQQLTPLRRSIAARKLADVSSNRDDDMPVLARRAALVLASGTAADVATSAELRHRLHAALTTPSWDHDATVRDLSIALQVAELVPDLVEHADLVWLTRFAETELRTRAHAMLALLGEPMPVAARYDRHNVRALDSDNLLRLLAEPHVIGKATLVDEAARRELAAAHPAIIQLADQTLARTKAGECDLLDADTRILESSVKALRAHLSNATISLFDRMLRHPNHHVKWELLQDPPRDPRLLGGMFHVLGEKWGWQEKTAK
ncbi:MAG: hypothetical protein H0T79_08190, partial [Deltaproteobacteria bacterium]|nr:hypothetical protein [Deltaproteobacteria bacterium]